MLLTGARVVALLSVCALAVVATPATPAMGATTVGRPVAAAPQGAGATPAKVALYGAALVAGVGVGLIPALLLGMALELVPRPHLLSSRRGERAPPPNVRLAPEQAPYGPGLPPTFAAHYPDRAGSLAAALPISVRPDVELEPPPQQGADAAAARERRRQLYDDAYSKQLRHIEALRHTITARLAVPADARTDDAPSDGASSPPASDG
jgi:hypothetical protein